MVRGSFIDRAKGYLYDITYVATLAVFLISLYSLPLSHRGYGLPSPATPETGVNLNTHPDVQDEILRADDYLQIAGEFLAQAEYDSSNQYYSKAKNLYRLNGDWENYIFCLNSIGYNLTVQGEYERAEEILEKALSFGMENFGKQSYHTAQSLNNLGRLNTETGNYNTALTLHKQALTIRRSIYGEEHEDVAHSYNNIGVVHWFLGNRFKVEEYFIKTLVLRRKLLSPPHPDIAGILYNMGFVYRDRGDYRTAIEYYEEALEMRRELHEDIHPQVASAYLTLGGVYRNLGYLDIAEEYYRKALSIRRQIFGPEHPSVAAALQSIARVYEQRRDPVTGLSYVRQAYDIIHSLYGEDHPFMPELAELIGHFYSELRNFEEAEKYYEFALNAIIKRFGESHPAVVTNLLNLASIERRRAEYNIALGLLERALEIQIKIGNPYALSSIYHAICKVYEVQEDYDRAAREIRRAIDIIKDKTEEHGRRLGDYHMHLGYHKVQKGDYQTGLSTLQKGLIHLVPGFSDKSVYANPVISTSLSDRYLLDVLNKKAFALVSYFENITGDVRDLEAALHTYETASALIDKLRTGISSEDGKFLLSEKTDHIYENAIRVAINLYDRRNDPEYLEKAYSFTEKNRAVALWEALTESNARRFSGIPDSLLQREITLRNELAYYQIEILREQLDSNTLAEFKSRYYRMYTEYEDLINLFETEFPDYYSLKFKSEFVTIDDLQSILDDSEAVLQYYLGRKSLILFIVTNMDIRVHSIDIDESFANMINDFNHAIRRIDRERFLRTGNELFDMLIGPAVPYIRNADRLVIIPDGLLYHIPFEALVSDVSGDTFSDLPFLIKQYVISYHYSSTLYHTLAQNRDTVRKPDGIRFAGFAPVFDENLSHGFILTSEGRESVYRNDESSSYWFGPIPYSKEELEGILSIFDEYEVPARGYFYNHAHKHEFISQARNFTILHLASHGFVNPAQPELSGILLAAPPAATSISDGIVYAGEFYNLDLSADLVVLSSCESGTGDIIRGEGLMAMTRGFLYSGAQNMIVSLWKVFDRQTKDLMIAFYRSVLSGNTYAEALRDAKLLMLEDEWTAFPHLWSGFILIGR